jgi:NADPH2:quinone reductase
MKAARIRSHGGPEVIEFEDVPVPKPGLGEVLVRNHAIGVNFVDTYLRSGAFKPPAMPFIPGKEAAGEVLAVGPGVQDFVPGDRVAFVETLGAYADQTVVPAHFLVHC